MAPKKQGFTLEPITLASQSHTAPSKQPHKAASSKQTSKRPVFKGTEGASSRVKKKDLSALTFASSLIAAI
ncbi:hypothetical protein CCACVL1_13846 [Corchorus capsularis]|uniref:Uncharacterized protein n=1 Tax=Corchorus capsularis TaxID=210143 RepID=A0A1R3I9H5_COCAP|nr:hypothetical protein CCACVL1_13846 [Corchorus capsularis]